MDIFMLQASILENIQQITDFTYMDDVNMTPANLMVAIRLLVKCELTLENIESALNIASPGSKYQYYRQSRVFGLRGHYPRPKTST